MFLKARQNITLAKQKHAQRIENQHNDAAMLPTKA